MKQKGGRGADNPLTTARNCSAAAVVIPARGKAVVPTDLAIACPSGTYARIAPRSGLAVKHFIDTGAGVVDEDYRGAVGVVLFNHGSADFQGERAPHAKACSIVRTAAVCLPSPALQTGKVSALFTGFADAAV